MKHEEIDVFPLCSLSGVPLLLPPLPPLLGPPSCLPIPSLTGAPFLPPHTLPYWGYLLCPPPPSPPLLGPLLCPPPPSPPLLGPPSVPPPRPLQGAGRLVDWTSRQPGLPRITYVSVATVMSLWRMTHPRFIGCKGQASHISLDTFRRHRISLQEPQHKPSALLSTKQTIRPGRRQYVSSVSALAEGGGGMFCAL